MVLESILSLASIPITIATVEGIRHQREKEKKNKDADEQYRMRDFHLDVYCSANSRKRDEVDKTIVILRDGKVSLQRQQSQNFKNCFQTPAIAMNDLTKVQSISFTSRPKTQTLNCHSPARDAPKSTTLSRASTSTFSPRRRQAKTKCSSVSIGRRLFVDWCLPSRPRPVRL